MDIEERSILLAFFDAIKDVDAGMLYGMLWLIRSASYEIKELRDLICT